MDTEIQARLQRKLQSLSLQQLEQTELWLRSLDTCLPLSPPQQEVSDFLAAYDLELLTMVPEHLLRRYGCVPLAWNDGTLTLGMSDPDDLTARDDIERTCGFQVVSQAMERELVEGVQAYCFQHKSMAAVESMMKELSAVDLEDALDGFDSQNLTALQDPVSEAPIVRVVNLLLSQAIQARATTLHIEPSAGSTQIHCRVDGELRLMMDSPIHIHKPLLVRLKVMADLEIWKQCPQSGRIEMNSHGRHYQLRLTVAPGLHGERAVVKFNYLPSSRHTFAELGATQQVAKKIGILLERPRGMIVVTGPAGSGVSTTLGFLLNRLSAQHQSVLAYVDGSDGQRGHLGPNVRTVAADPTGGFVGAEVLRVMKEMDPDVICFPLSDRAIIPDLLHLAASQCKVVTSMDSSWTWLALARLLELGALPLTVSEGISGVVTQRLLPKLCENCKVEVKPEEPMNAPIWRGRGCDECAGRGTRGRIGIYEVLVMSSGLRERLATGTGLGELREAACAEGALWSLEQDAREKLLQGIIDYSQYLRVANQ